MGRSPCDGRLPYRVRVWVEEHVRGASLGLPQSSAQSRLTLIALFQAWPTSHMDTYLHAPKLQRAASGQRQ